MMLIPIGHEHTETRRLPVISLVILALNLVVFLFTYVREHGRVEAESGKAAREAVAYYFHHTYLSLREDFERFYELGPDSDVGRRIQAINESAQRPDAATIASEQAELDRLCDAAMASIHQSFYQRLGYVPAHPSFFTLLSSMFCHAGWLHLIGNMLFFYLSAPFIEDVYGRGLFSAFYLVGGAIATLTHAAKFPQSEVPLVGASGAIAALMGAFLIRYIRTRIRFAYLFIFFFRIFRGTFWAPAYVMLPLWLLQQLFEASAVPDGAVAVWAHIGGFLFGVLVACVMRQFQIEDRFISPRIEQQIGTARNEALVKGSEARLAGNLKLAKSFLSRAVREVPDDPDAHLELFRTLAALGDATAAKPRAARYIQMMLKDGLNQLAWEAYLEAEGLEDVPWPWPPAALIGLARYREKAGDDSAAVALYTAVGSSGDPAAARALAGLGGIHARRREPREAIEAFTRALHVPRIDADVARQIEARLREVAENNSIALPRLPKVAPKGLPPPVAIPPPFKPPAG